MAKSDVRSPKKRGLGIFQKLSLFFFDRPRTTGLIWLALLMFGIASYTTLLKREGFPAVETPFAVVQGTYLVQDSSKVDKEVSEPLGKFILQQSGIKSFETQSLDNFYLTTIAFKDGVNSEVKSQELQKKLQEQKILPPSATVEIKPFRFGLTERGDDYTVAFYSKNPNVDTAELASVAKKAAEVIKSEKLSLVEDVSIIDPFETATNPTTGEQQVQQKTFDRFGKRENNQTIFHNSIVIGITSKSEVDEIELDKQVRGAIEKINNDSQFSNYHADVGGSNAHQIKAQVNELQRTLLEGLLAVLLVGWLVIALRASLITIISMISVLAIVIGIFYAIGYSLNTITLFALILGLSLIVDDTIIMVEALDAQRKKQKYARQAVKVATGKVGRAMLAATLTAALSFTPLLFVGGVLGKFIRAIPITIITALLVSLLVSLIVIPLLAKYIMLRPKRMGVEKGSNLSSKIESSIARQIARPMLWAKGSRERLFAVGIGALIIGFGFIGAGGYLFQKVTFNIFPSSKDANQINILLSFSPGTDLQKAQVVTDKANEITAKVINENFLQANYFAVANTQSATAIIDLTDYKDRDIASPKIVENLTNELSKLEGAKAEVRQLDAGPPPSEFSARVSAGDNREAASKLAIDVATFLEKSELKRPDGSVATVKNVQLPNPNVYARDSNEPFISVTAGFNDTDTTTLVTLAQQAVEKEFPPTKVASYGLDKNSLSFDFGQESENQDSFKTLALAFPAVLLVIYVLLALEFKSFLQPLLIFMAIPFSLFGITLGLYLTDNAFSFFAMLGFFALIGLSIKNTILLTDYANQSRNNGMGAVDAAVEALSERFRPLIATSLTAIVSLIPLAITSPFWEGLAVVLIFGLMSSTFLVITVFPYYYLGSEYLRQRFNPKPIILWLIASAVLVAILLAANFGTISILAPVVAALLLVICKRLKLI